MIYPNLNTIDCNVNKMLVYHESFSFEKGMAEFSKFLQFFTGIEYDKDTCEKFSF